MHHAPLSCYQHIARAEARVTASALPPAGPPAGRGVANQAALRYAVCSELSCTPHWAPRVFCGCFVPDAFSWRRIVNTPSGVEESRHE